MTKQQRDTEHSDLVNLAIYDADICGKIDCYFEPNTGNLWHAYVGDHDIVEIIRDTTIAWLEAHYAKHRRDLREENKLELALARAGC